MRRLPRWAAVAGLILAAATLAAPSPLGAQEGDDDLRIFHEEGGPGDEVTLVVTTPPAVIGADLPSAAFSVVQDGTAVPAEVDPYEPEGLEIVLVMGARSSAALNAEQGSGAEFLRFLGDSAKMAVVDASEPRTLVPMTDAGDRVGQALLDVENAASSEPTSEAAVETALEEFTDDADRRAVVLMTDDDGAVSPSLAGRLVEADASLLYIQAAVDADPVPSLVDAAVASGGRAQQGDLRGLIRTVDEVRSDLDNQYRVRFQAGESDDVEVQVLTAGGLLTGAVDLSTPAPTVPPRDEEPGAPPATEASAQQADAGDDDGGGSGGVLLAVALLLLLVIGAGLAALLLVRRRRHEEPEPGPVVVDLRETPTPAPGEASPVGDARSDPGD